MDNAPKKIYKFIPFFDNGNSKVNKRNIETIEEKKVWASKYFSLNDPFEFNGMYLDEEKISASGNNDKKNPSTTLSTCPVPCPRN